MPPAGAGEPPTEEEIELIREWIDGGHFADYVEVETSFDRDFTEAEAPEVTVEDRQTWAFRKPVAAALPEGGEQGPGADADRLVHPFQARRARARSVSTGFKANLLRRAYFDLWGLPPTPAAAAEFSRGYEARRVRAAH